MVSESKWAGFKLKQCAPGNLSLSLPHPQGPRHGVGRDVGGRGRRPVGVHAVGVGVGAVHGLRDRRPRTAVRWRLEETKIGD